MSELAAIFGPVLFWLVVLILVAAMGWGWLVIGIAALGVAGGVWWMVHLLTDMRLDF